MIGLLAPDLGLVFALAEQVGQAPDLSLGGVALASLGPVLAAELVGRWADGRSAWLEQLSGERGGLGTSPVEAWPRNSWWSMRGWISSKPRSGGAGGGSPPVC